jgi:hypothetical protein
MLNDSYTEDKCSYTETKKCLYVDKDSKGGGKTYILIYKGRWCRTPLILKLNTRWQWVVNATPEQIFPKETTPVMSLGGTKSPFDHFRDKTKLLNLSAVEPDDAQPVAHNYTDYTLPAPKATRVSEKTVMATRRPLEKRRQYRLREMLHQGCWTTARGNISIARNIQCCPDGFCCLCPTSVSILWRICVCIGYT